MYLFIILYIILFFFKLHLCLFVRSFIHHHVVVLNLYADIVFSFFHLFSPLHFSTQWQLPCLSSLSTTAYGLEWYLVFWYLIFLVNYSFLHKSFNVWTSLSPFQNICGYCSQLCGKTCPSDSMLGEIMAIPGCSAHSCPLIMLHKGMVMCAERLQSVAVFSVKWKEEQPEEPQHGRAASE